MNNTILQFPSRDETTLDEWTEASSDVTEGPDKFLQWEAERSLMRTIGDLVATQDPYDDWSLE